MYIYIYIYLDRYIGVSRNYGFLWGVAMMRITVHWYLYWAFDSFRVAISCGRETCLGFGVRVVLLGGPTGSQGPWV